ncbi:ABC transporter permease [Cyanobium sp. T1G-Tous]|uniref:ABC transporter permease n=1 Tax=unclassified Cyanobium TaxID=2627006 RepID=UPI0020CB77F7|nr:MULTISPECIES: ABC transporter permease [unclassified Cyanobium]MCP9777501.1 ABC transporter permease [Cyanobium sp. Tous-M-B4]MCP9803801.1 ABC transporter permease [Cyanobium sp. T1G-Tous]MCP9877381.1 ABC transporter permease [Cyanobium sp. A2C-AMD]
MPTKLPMRETVGMALSTLRSNRLRSLLTMLGIVIGNASVITLVGVGRGAQNLAEGQLSNLGANVLFVVPGNNDTRRQGIDFPKNLVLEDALAIGEQVPSVKRVAPQITLSEVVQAGGLSSSTSIFGVTPEFLPVRQFEIAQGRFFTASDLNGARNVTVVGPDLGAKMFPGKAPVGRQLRIRNQLFEVIGVLEPKGAVFGQNQDENAYVPLSTMVSKLSGRDPTYGVSLNFISVEARDEQSTGAASFQITNLLRQRHRILREDDFAVRSQKDALTIVSTITGGLTLMLAAIGAVSLLVGGIGIMNIMLVSVSERTEEIGLRKALGARSGDVLLQFLVESLVLASLGGVIGSAVGLGTVAVVGALTPLPASIGAATVLVTVGLSGSIGLFFGVVPARRAARLDPIVALRSL